MGKCKWLNWSTNELATSLKAMSTLSTQRLLQLQKKLKFMTGHQHSPISAAEPIQMRTSIGSRLCVMMREKQIIRQCFTGWNFPTRAIVLDKGLPSWNYILCFSIVKKISMIPNERRDLLEQTIERSLLSGRFSEHFRFFTIRHRRHY